MRIAALFASVLIVAAPGGAALADSAPAPSPDARFADPDGVVLAVRNDFGARDGAVRLSVYRAENFLEDATAKVAGEFENGIAILPIRDLEPGDYAFVAYFDENGDGKLNRNFVGAPKEPFGFSNGVRPKLSKPSFEDAKVRVAKGSVVTLTIED